MTEKKTKTEVAAKPAKKAVAPQTPVKAVKVKKMETAKGTVTLIQIASPIGREASQRATLICLGLNKIRRTKTLQDTPSIRGMIAKVKHLVEVVA